MTLVEAIADALEKDPELRMEIAKQIDYAIRGKTGFGAAYGKAATEAIDILVTRLAKEAVQPGGAYYEAAKLVAEKEAKNKLAKRLKSLGMDVPEFLAIK